ncbi:MAG: hypothetical protein ACK4YP_00500, partial [Myxococcota bacterium]
MTRALVLAGVGVLLVVFVGLPLALLALGADDLALALRETEAIVNTLLLAGGTAALACGVGVPVGWVAAGGGGGKTHHDKIALAHTVTPPLT